MANPNFTTIKGNNFPNTLTGTVGNDRLFGLGGNDTLSGGNRNNFLDGGLGDDSLTGGGGDDTFSVTDGSDVITDLGSGQDTLNVSQFGAVRANLATDWTADVFSSNDASAFLYALGHNVDVSLTNGTRGWNISNSSPDSAVTLTGSRQNDTLIGGDGNDVLTGGKGVDIIDGGAGDDVFIWRVGDGNDTITLGDGNNILAFDGIDSTDWSYVDDGAARIFIHTSGARVTVTDYQPDGDTYDVTCILPGTLITTPEGQRPIEHLAPGDMVTTPEAPRAVRWVGRSHYSMAFLQGKRMSMPVCIHAGALAEGLPARNLWVSPWHALLFGETLVRAFDLLNGQNVTQDYRGAVASFYNVELDSPDIIFAEGVPVETYANHNNRALFHNLDEYLALYGSQEPSWMGADGVGIRRHKLLDENAPELAPIRQAVLARAAACPGIHAA